MPNAMNDCFHSPTSWPPFCRPGPDGLPLGPQPGSPESRALAAWEVLTGVRLARSAGSGRQSLLGRHHNEPGELTRERVLWIVLHAFEGAEERWALRLCRGGALSDVHLLAAVIQEMGGPPDEPDELTALGFWKSTRGFHFDCRGPSVELTHLTAGRCQLRAERIGAAAIVSHARRLLGIGFALQGNHPEGRTGRAGADDDEQLLLL
jgi:hypothetical protein